MKNSSIPHKYINVLVIGVSFLHTVNTQSTQQICFHEKRNLITTRALHLADYKGPEQVSLLYECDAFIHTCYNVSAVYTQLSK